MIKTAEEFIALRSSSDPAEYNRAAHEEAPIAVWRDVISKYPDYKKWVIHNKKVPLEILEFLAKDMDPEIRADVASKRKISESIFSALSKDPDENVRYTLAHNPKLSLEKLLKISNEGSTEFKKALEEKLKNKSFESI